MKFNYLIRIGFFALLPALAAAAGTDVGAAGRPQATPQVPWPPPREEVAWHAPGARDRHPVHLHLLAFNDFHGHLETPVAPDGGRPAGGAAVLAAYLKAAAARDPAHTLIVHAGDQMGASPPINGLLHNEPSIQLLNILADPHRCPYGRATHFYAVGTPPDACNVIGTPGNHEFDGGPEELLRLLNGGNAQGGPFLQAPWHGSRVPYVGANVIDRRTGRTLLPPYAVVDVHGIRVGVIGAVLTDTKTKIAAWAGRDLEFTDEADAINRAARELARHGVKVIVVTIHQGVVPVRENGGFRQQDGRYEWTGPLLDIVAHLDPSISLVISGHTHDFTNALFPDRTGRPVLVTQAYSYGLAYADIDLTVDHATGRVIAAAARVLPTWTDTGPGLAPEPHVAALVRAARAMVEPKVAAVVAQATAPITHAGNRAGESPLGDLAADAQRNAVHADLAFVNASGLRTDLRAGPVRRGDLMTVHPFANHVVALRMTGAQVLGVLEQQWSGEGTSAARMLEVSGFSYVWDASRPVGARVVATCDARSQPLRPDASYRVAVNDFLSGGGDEFDGFKAAQVEQVGPTDADALEQWFRLQSRDGQPPAIDPKLDGRIAVPGMAAQCQGRAPGPAG